MKLLKYIILGLIQGFTEPLPISSSGHLILIEKLFNSFQVNNLNFEIILNFSSFLAILLIYRKNICNLISGYCKYVINKNKVFINEFKIVNLIIVGTIPVGIIGLIIKKPLEILLSGKPYMIGFGFLISALFLYLVKDKENTKKKEDLSARDALIIGLFQSIALLPGISRSGMTLVGCLFRKLSKEDSLNFTFFLYFPVSILTIILGLFDLDIANININMTLISFIITFISTIISFKVLKEIIMKKKLIYFSYYLLFIGMISIIFLK